MDRRVLLAVILTAVVIVVTPLLFPGAPPTPGTTGATATAVHPQPVPTGRTRTQASSTTKVRKVDTTAAEVPPAAVAKPPEQPLRTDSLGAQSKHMTLWYANTTASPLHAVLLDYASRDTSAKPGPVVLQPAKDVPLMTYRLRIGDTTVDVRDTSMKGTIEQSAGREIVHYRGTIDGRTLVVTYAAPKTNENRYLTEAQVTVSPAPATGAVEIALPYTLLSAESDTADDIRQLGFAYKPVGGGVGNIGFGKLDSGQTRVVPGPLEWAAVRNKYFLVAVMTPDSGIGGARFTGGRRAGKLAPNASGSVSVPLKNGHAVFELYTGPQEFERLRALGHGLDEVKQYAGWLHGMVQPFATLVTLVLLWMKRTSGLSYGWVIIIFGIVVRLLLWPLNQSAMRTSIRMQRIQPELSEVQKKYKSDPKKQQEALVKLYQAHGMTPFSPMMGCLPMLLPMPILFALYWVFLSTIEFRGVSFLWMHDISAADPYYITPIVMGLSMFALSWIGMRGTPPTTQTRIMSYMMPVVFTFMFFRFAAGLNLYYAVQNIAALPQQWLLSRERIGVGTPAKGGKQRE